MNKFNNYNTVYSKFTQETSSDNLSVRVITLDFRNFVGLVGNNDINISII